MKTEQPVLITTIQAAADLSNSKNLLIAFDGTLCGNGAKPLGVLNSNTSNGNQAPIVTCGIALVLSGATVSKGDKLQCNASSKAITYSSGAEVGYALDAATGADELIRIRLS